MAQCIMTTCDKQAYCKNLCKAHYNRLWKYGSPEGGDGTVTYTRTRNGKEQTVTRRVRTDEMGWAKHPLYKVWSGMRYRCRDPKARSYKWYGGRGITVCDEWGDNFLAFKDWAVSHGYEPGMELDRINNDMGYAPENCRWVTKLENLANRGGYLPEELQDRLHREAAERGVSVTSLIRDAVEAYLDSYAVEGR